MQLVTNGGNPGSARGLLSINGLSRQDAWQLIKDALAIKRGETKPDIYGQTVALLFEKPSLRTRVSFEVAVRQMGGISLYLSPAEVGLGQREQIPDVARTLSRYVQAIVARTFSHETLESLTSYASVPVINALSDLEHPCQALGDFLTIYEKKGELKGLKVAFIGDGNNVANSLILTASLVGTNFCIACPPNYEIREEILQRAHTLAKQSGANISCVSDPSAAATHADIIYTDVWVSMGQETESESRIKDFTGYQVDERLLSLANSKALFMHPLPAHHGEEIAEGLLDHPQSIVFDQAENRLHIQKAILAKFLPSSSEL